MCKRGFYEQFFKAANVFNEVSCQLLRNSPNSPRPTMLQNTDGISKHKPVSSFTAFVSTRMLYCTEVFTWVLYFVFDLCLITLSSYSVGKWHKEAFSRERRRSGEEEVVKTHLATARWAHHNLSVTHVRTISSAHQLDNVKTLYTQFHTQITRILMKLGKTMSF